MQSDFLRHQEDYSSGVAFVIIIAARPSKGGVLFCKRGRTDRNIDISISEWPCQTLQLAANKRKKGMGIKIAVFFVSQK